MTPDTNSPVLQNDTNACLLYLSGDLSTVDSAAFEQRLANSPELANELLAQSDLINHVALFAGEPITAATPAVYSTRYLTAALTVAASLAMIAALWVPPTNENKPATQEMAVARLGSPQTNQPQEDRLIAEAWATTDAEIFFLSDDLDLDSERSSDAWPKSSYDESSLSWVTAAIESGASIDG